MYKVYIENSAVCFASSCQADARYEMLRLAPGEGLCITKLLQKLQFTKQLYVISDQSEQVFEQFRASMPFIEAGGGLVLNNKEEILMIFRNNRWDLPKGKQESGETIETCAVREVSEECGLPVGELLCGAPITQTYHSYRMRGQWILKRTSWFHMRFRGNQTPCPQIVEGITRAQWIRSEQVVEFLRDTYFTIGDVFRAAGYRI